LAKAVASVWIQPARSIVEELNLSEQVYICSGRDVFDVEGRDTWVVLDGALDLFVVHRQSLETEAGIGKRHYLATVAAGGTLFGLPEPDAGLQLIAVPTANTSLAKLSRAGLLGLLQRDRATSVSGEDAAEGDVEAANMRLRGLGESIMALFADMARHAPYSAQTVNEAGDVALKEGEPLIAGRRLLWLQAGGTTFEMSGCFEIEPQGKQCLPFCAGAWFAPATDGTARLLDTLSWLGEADVEGDLDRLLALAMRITTVKLERAGQQEHNLAQQRETAEEDRFDAALHGLLNVFRRGNILRSGNDRSALGSAMARVLEVQGCSLVLSPDREKRLLERPDPLDSLASAAGLQARRVALTGQWWLADHGPLVAWLDDDVPVALIPRRGGGYAAVGHTSAEPEAITAATAGRYGKDGWFLFAPFPSGKLTARRIAAFGVRGLGLDVWLVGWMVILGGILSLVTPIVTGWIMDPIIPDSQLYQLYVLTAALMITGMAMAGFGLVQSLSMLRIEGAMDFRVQAAVWDRLLKLEAGFFRGHSVGDLANRAQSINTMRQLLTGSVTTSLIHGVIGTFSLGLMIYFDWRLAAVSAFAALVYGIIAFLIGRKVLSRYRDMLELTGRIQSVVLQLLSGVAKIRVAGAEHSAFERWSKHYAELMRITFVQGNLNNMLVVFTATFHAVAIAAVLVVLGLQGDVLFAVFDTPDTWSRIDGDPLSLVMPTASFVAFNVALGQFLSAVFGLTGVAIKLVNIRPLFDRVRPILTGELEHDEDANDPGELAGNVEIRDVVFSYDKDLPPVLKGLSLEAHEGEFVALVGQSGAGKSTIVRLLLGFDTPSSGTVFVDGKDLAYIDRRAVRRQFGVVLQNSRVLAGSIFHNIAAGSNVTRDDAWEAARQAGLDGDIEAMPMGMETFLNEGAGTLSGGQRQRLMIARALVRRPRVVIFDEATSALDNRTQSVVSESLDHMNCTRIVIAHRLSTIINADKIYVLDAGHVVEEGNYRELMERGGLFADLARRQIV
ncbi:MAG: NHLP bacteriocin export ABC transporter permease/ATPase subunit, partial [Alphaproteobacteria bacterium]|nr:NHLP bacteriocin export ABC transporter permease/ATPase subunit [Alphaproteobacteria bacterium]